MPNEIEPFQTPGSRELIIFHPQTRELVTMIPPEAHLTTVGEMKDQPRGLIIGAVLVEDDDVNKNNTGAGRAYDMYQQYDEDFKRGELERTNTTIERLENTLNERQREKVDNWDIHEG